MPTLAHAAPKVSADGQARAGLQLALDAFSKDLAAQLVALVHAQLGTTKTSRKAVEKVVADSVPVLLEQAFVGTFLSGKAQAREHRAVLSHVLSAAELQATVGNDWSALMQGTGAAKAASGADEDEELTSEAASKLLHVSRTHLNALADSGAFGVVRRTEGGHRRISKVALLRYKAESKERQTKGLDAMVATSQKIGLYDAELKGLPKKGGR